MSLSESTYFNSGMTFKRAQASNTLSHNGLLGQPKRKWLTVSIQLQHSWHLSDETTLIFFRYSFIRQIPRRSLWFVLILLWGKYFIILKQLTMGIFLSHVLLQRQNTPLECKTWKSSISQVMCFFSWVSSNNVTCLCCRHWSTHVATPGEQE